MPSTSKKLSMIALLMLLLGVPAAVSQSDLDLMAEQRVITYVRQHVTPGEFFLVSDLYKVYKLETEKRAIDRLYNIFFKIPLFVARYKKDTGRFPTLDDIARDFELEIPGEVPLLLSIFDADPRAPKFFTRDPKSGEIVGMDIKAVGDTIRSFGLDSLDGGSGRGNKTVQNGPEPVATQRVPCEKRGDVALAKALARPLIADGSGVEGTEYFYNRVDLNGDGVPEILAYMRGPHSCSSSGCEMFVLRQEGSQYSVIAKMLMGWSPIIVSSKRTKGWNDLILWEGTSGARSSGYIVIPFDGKTYQKENAYPLGEKVEGTFFLSNSHDVGVGIRLPLGISAYGTPDPGEN